MKFLLLVHESPSWPSLPAPQRFQIARACDDWHRDLEKRGVGLAAIGLHPPEASFCVRKPENQDPVVTDGPFAETVEVLGGFELITCRDRAEAEAIAASFPALACGFTLEVRPVMSAEDLRQHLGV